MEKVVKCLHFCGFVESKSGGVGRWVRTYKVWIKKRGLIETQEEKCILLAVVIAPTCIANKAKAINTICRRCTFCL